MDSGPGRIHRIKSRALCADLRQRRTGESQRAEWQVIEVEIDQHGLVRQNGGKSLGHVEVHRKHNRAIGEAPARAVLG
jgi:hypothetical protein